jgi:hypothetical protein
VTVTFSNSPPALERSAGAVVTGPAGVVGDEPIGVTCEIALIGTKTWAADQTIRAARHRLADIFFIPLLEFAQNDWAIADFDALLKIVGFLVKLEPLSLNKVPRPEIFALIH